ncbi:MAG: DUF456 domain-containing protein [Candidatus Promineifilaceae bacterium]
MSVLVEALAFGIAVALMIVGVIGTIIPVLPGLLLIWLTVLGYALQEQFQAIDWVTFVVLTVIALVAGTADIWLSALGAKTGGASRRAMFLGFVGSIIGLILGTAIPIPIFGNLIGSVLGYAVGLLLGQYHKYHDWNLAIRASLGGVAGWGVATAVQFGGGVLILILFVWQVLAY